VVPDLVIASLTDFAKLPIPGGIFDLDGTIVAMNAAAEELLRRPSSQVIGRKAWDIAPGAEYVWEEVLANARRDGSHRGEISIATPQEPRLIYYVVTHREFDGHRYVVLFALDLPDERSARNTDVETQHRLEALGLVAGGIAHDFNNQLVSVLAEASVARENSALDDSTREALRRIEIAAHRMAQLTRQLLAYAGRGRFITELIDPDELVQQTQEALARTVRPDAVLNVSTGAGRIALEADRGLLRQVIQNLVVNASEALGEGGGAITIETRVEARNWVLEIRDTGAGMDTHTSARIFDPFFTTKRDRHGLGLSAVHGIVRRLGGEITVETKLGSGTQFRIMLPVVAGAEPVRKRTTSRQPAVTTLSGIRVLIADDEPGVLSTVKRLLERRGAQVVVASDGPQAKARLADGEYQILLFDVMMPELTGYQLLPIARQLQPDAKVMLMSGYSEHTRGPGGGQEPDAFLEKPFTASVLDEAIDELLANR
jgi:signal transduction histidine kinase/CheY-like chemotaxis protein